MKGRQIVYRYNGDASTDEVEVDPLGEMHIPTKGEEILRKGQPWKVVEAMTQVSTNPREFPVHYVFLSNKP